MEGPWLLYDNLEDPYQMNNLVNNEKYRKIQEKMTENLSLELKKHNDKFLTGQEYMDAFNLRWYNLDSVKTDDYIKLLAR